MKTWKILVNGALALLLLGAVLLTENERYAFFSQIGNPFDITQKIEDLSENSSEKIQEIFTENGEFFRIYPNTRLSFSDQDRNLESGNLFISSEFVDQKRYTPNKIKGSFDPQNFKFGPSSLRVNQLFLDMGQASAFIIRDEREQLTKIYAINHSIDVLFPNAREPFTVPAEMNISVEDFQIDEKTPKIYYSKLKKEFELNPFFIPNDVPKTLEESELSIEEKIWRSLQKKEAKRESIKKFAQNEPHTWVWFDVKNIIGNFSQILKNAQANVAVGYSKNKRDENDFKSLIIPFVKASIAVENNDPDEAKKQLKIFSEHYKSPRWVKLNEKSEFSKEWEKLVLAQKAWTQTIFPEDPAYIFFEFWNPEKDLNSFQSIEQKFSSIELLLSNYRYTKAEEILLRIKSGLQKIDIKSENSIALTKMRRVFHEIVKTKRSLQKTKFFDLYYEFVRTEIEVYQSDRSKQEEIRLEVVQDIIPFLKEEELLDAKKINALGRIFIILDLEQIIKTKEISKSIQADIHVISEIVRTGGNTELSDAIAESQKELEARERKKCERLRNCPQNDGKPVKPVQNQKIDSSEKLKKWFEKSGFKSEKLVLRQQEDFILFKSLKHKKYAINGTLDIKAQKFINVKIHKTKNPSIALKLFRQAVFATVKKIELDEASKINPKDDKLPNQNHPIAITRKNEIKDYFEALGITANLSGITALEANYNNFSIEGARYKDRVTINGTYLFFEDEIKNIGIQFGKKPPIEPEISIKRDDFPDLIQRKIFEVFAIDLDE